MNLRMFNLVIINIIVITTMYYGITFNISNKIKELNYKTLKRFKLKKKQTFLIKKVFKYVSLILLGVFLGINEEKISDKISVLRIFYYIYFFIILIDIFKLIKYFNIDNKKIREVDDMTEDEFKQFVKNNFQKKGFILKNNNNSSIYNHLIDERFFDFIAIKNNKKVIVKASQYPINEKELETLFVEKDFTDIGQNDNELINMSIVIVNSNEITVNKNKYICHLGYNKNVMQICWNRNKLKEILKEI